MGGLILLGSLLFAVGSPFGARLADRSGPRLVAVQAVLGYAACFGLIGVAVGLADAGRWSRGIAEPQLSLMAWRSAVILNDVAGREVFDVGDSDGPVVWQALDQQRWSEAI